MKVLILWSFFFISSITYAQEIVTDLYGFRLGQFRDVPKKELKVILQSNKFEDGFEFEIFPVEKDTSVYMIFEYANYDLHTIWSMQLTGNKKGFDCLFKGLKLGMSENKLIKILGKPSSVEDAGQYGKRWVYDNTNYSLEITTSGTLGGIKIMDLSKEFYPKPDLKSLPKFSAYSKIIKSKNREAISELLAPGIEIYKGDSVYFFKSTWRNEIENDQSGLFTFLNETAEILSMINPQDSLQYQENMRFELGQDTKHVAKFNVNGIYTEIVFKYMFGGYLIWEIKLN